MYQDKHEFSTFYLNVTTNGVWRRRAIAPRCLNLITRWSWVVTFMSGAVYPCKWQTIPNLNVFQALPGRQGRAT